MHVRLVVAAGRMRPSATPYVPNQYQGRSQSERPVEGADPGPSHFIADVVERVPRRDQQEGQEAKSPSGRQILAQMPAAPDMNWQQRAQYNQREHGASAMQTEPPDFQRMSGLPELTVRKHEVVKDQP